MCFACSVLTGPVPQSSAQTSSRCLERSREDRSSVRCEVLVGMGRWASGAERLRPDISRYNQLRKGVAIAIFVTETFSNTLRVKADPGKHGPADEFPVMKLNLVKDYQTGIYDYNDMLSTFVALAPVNRRLSATPTKISFSSQEWCGHVYSQLLFGEQKARLTQHSYFDGEADQQRDLDYPEDGFSEDALMLWARGMARPFLNPGATGSANMLTSLETARGKHIPLAWAYQTLSRDRDRKTCAYPPGVSKSKCSARLGKTNLGARITLRKPRPIGSSSGRRAKARKPNCLALTG